MKRRSLTHFQIGVFLIAALALSLGTAFADKEPPGPKLSGGPKPAEDTERSNPYKVPYVGPQTKAKGPPDASGTSHTVTPSRLVTDPNAKGRKGRAAAAGLSWGKDIYASSVSWPIDCNLKQVSLATHGNKYLYIAYVMPAYHDPANETLLAFDYSDDGGLTWKDKGYIWITGKDANSPSLAVTDDTVVVAYVVKPEGADPYVEVATASRSTAAERRASAIPSWVSSPASTSTSP